MAQRFSGYPKTVWIGNPKGPGNKDVYRGMTLLEAFSYTDKRGKKWTSPEGCYVNGATIPEFLWSRVGSPFTGEYRRASVIHDYYVGEGRNPDVSKADRIKADKIFHEGCLHDGCSRAFAGMLYIGVRFGTWGASLKNKFKNFKGRKLEKKLLEEYDNLVSKLSDSLEVMEFDELEKEVEKHKPV
ncbi:MAG: DUF1353 domain-containing protein [Flavobacteriales bacterium]|nr:DUF1353 domain-containing protein [Flavobacteriales bacterium]